MAKQFSANTISTVTDKGKCEKLHTNAISRPRKDKKYFNHEEIKYEHN